MNWYVEVLSKYAVFTGRAHRTEYWMFVLINTIITIVFNLLGLELIVSLYALLVLIPSIAVAARRLHDTDRSGLWLLLAFIPVLGVIILIFFMVQDSTPGDNRFGANPKTAA